MQTTDSPNDLFFDQLRDIHSMEVQLIEALPRLIKLTGHPSLRELITDRLEEVEFQNADVVEIFRRHQVPPGSDKCKAIAGLIEGGEAHLEAVPHEPTRDLMMVAHCLRICYYAIAACEITHRLAGRLGMSGEAETLEIILSQENDAAEELLSLEFELFEEAHLTEDEISAQ